MNAVAPPPSLPPHAPAGDSPPRPPAGRPLAIVTGASSGIGLALAHQAAAAGHDLVIAADEPAIETAAADLRAQGAAVEAVQANLAEPAGIDALWSAVGDRPVACLLANAGIGRGGAFLDIDYPVHRHIVDTNIIGVVDLVHRTARRMRAQGHGRILVTGSIAGFTPGPLNSVYNATKAFIDTIVPAWRDEWRPLGITVTCLMPGATRTRFFERAGMTGTALAALAVDDPADVAREGWNAMIAGDAQVISGGWKNRLQAAAAHVVPPGLLAAAHRRLADPGSGTAEGQR